ncbi:MAG: Rieske 2Fe-2S domain-containing protein [Dehalococcoidia bacterium]|nr:Rieske 2Fe-2S domain-containing protein [Dehalococcoidia bacterium]
MLSERDTELLCRVSAGTAMGEVLRRFWQPVLLSEEVPSADGPPVAIRIMGEDLLAFRDTNGKVGLISAYCAHRHAHLFWGRNEECGLRCTYHGWKYDVTGQCVDMPNEPLEAAFKEKIKIAAYPTKEAGGCVWAYMGPPEKEPPELPYLEWTRIPTENVLVTKRLQQNNWAQAVEGGIDSSHISYLHNNNIKQQNLSTGDKAPMTLLQERDYGFIEAARRVTAEGKHYWRIRPFMVPGTIMIPSNDAPDRSISGHVWVPVDDHHVWVYTITWNATRALGNEEIATLLAGYGIHSSVEKHERRWDLKISNSYRPVRNIENDYLIDRPLQKDTSFTGIQGTSEQDCSIQESMGALSPRWEEHLGTADKGIIEFRKTLLQMARDMLEGKEPVQPHNPQAYRVRSTAFVVDPQVDWKEVSEEHMKALV